MAHVRGWAVGMHLYMCLHHYFIFHVFVPGVCSWIPQTSMFHYFISSRLTVQRVTKEIKAELGTVIFNSIEWSILALPRLEPNTVPFKKTYFFGHLMK